ncbi:hypothetical protein Q5752_005542 [Cryptotrichosporon argae]
MPIVERELSGFVLPADAPKAGATVTSFTLVGGSKASSAGFTYTLTFPLGNALKILLTGPNRPAPPHDNVVLRAAPLEFKVVALDAAKSIATLAFPLAASPLDGAAKTREIRLDWSDSILLDVWEKGASGAYVRVLGDLPARSYALTSHGIMRHWWIERDNLHLGLGEKAGPIDLTARSFQIHGTDAACYDTFEGDPLYKHTPYLVSTPRAKPGVSDPVSSYAIYHASNSVGQWDLGRHHDDPWGYFKTYIQDYGGLEEWVLLGKGVKQVTRTWAEVVGRPKLVGRDWLGYLASGMGLGESDEPIAQELLAEWPALCKKYDIPCSAIHFSSGYTVGDDGNRYVFTMNTKRYPDFKGLLGTLHKQGIKVVPNIKPYILATHPQFQGLYDANALFLNKQIDSPVVTRIWSSGVGVSAKGSWSDLTSKAGREWWRAGVQSLIDLGVDGMWNDNNEYYLHDDEFLCQNDLEHEVAVAAAPGPAAVGLVGRMFNTEIMGKVSHDTLVKNNPERRPYVLTRSANVGAFKYANSTWTGDNETSWKNLRGSQPIQLNAGISLMQSTGSDVGGFGGPLPTPELFTRWVQLGVTHARFCIHAFKPTPDDPSGASCTNLPWMYPEVLPAIRDAIKWRYEYLPYFNSLMWDSHTDAEPTNAWLGWGEFANDPALYTPTVLEGFDAWIGAGRLLSVPALFEGELVRDVYLPKASADDDSLYFDLHAPYGRHAAGTTARVSTPLEHMGLLAREGAVIPVGKNYHTVTQLSGPARTTIDGVDIQLESEGGVVGLDDYRGVQIFPSPKPGKTYIGTWTEDDGISADPAKAVVEVSYTSGADIEVAAKWVDSAFKPLWGKTLHILLPFGDRRTVKGAKAVALGDRVAYLVAVQ